MTVTIDMQKISVVTPTHNRPKTLRMLLDSLEAQSLPAARFEVLVVGNEEDLGRAVVQEFESRGRLDIRWAFIPDDPWKGRSASAKRNLGAKLAKNPWLAFTDDDCVADPRWLESATAYFDDERNGGVEGRKCIPPLDPPTLTHKGLLRFTREGGYQTANMFYRRDVFIEVGGFDLSFPFYLEDTDLAWTVLDRGYHIPHARDAVVEHPVSPPAPWRLLDVALRTDLVVRLFKKHPNRFRSAGMRAMPRSAPAYLALEAAALGAALTGRRTTAGLLALATGAVTLGHSMKLFHGCRAEAEEVLVTTMLLPVVPVVALVQLVRGNIRYRTHLFP